MPGIRPLAELVKQVRLRADMQNSQFVTDEEIEQYIQDSVGDLWDLIIESAGEEHFAYSVEFDTSPGVSRYTLTTDLISWLPPGPPETPPQPIRVYKTLGVDIQFGNRWVPAEPVRFGERNQAQAHSWSPSLPIGYRVVTDTNPPSPARAVDFYPAPTGVYTVKFWFIPYPNDLTGSGETWGSRAFQSFTGWDEYVVCDAAAKCLEKEESDPRYLHARKMAAAERIRWHALTMNQESGGRVRNIDAERRRRFYE